MRGGPGPAHRIAPRPGLAQARCQPLQDRRMGWRDPAARGSVRPRVRVPRPAAARCVARRHPEALAAACPSERKRGACPRPACGLRPSGPIVPWLPVGIESTQPSSGPARRPNEVQPRWRRDQTRSGLAPDREPWRVLSLRRATACRMGQRLRSLRHAAQSECRTRQGAGVHGVPPGIAAKRLGPAEASQTGNMFPRHGERCPPFFMEGGHHDHECDESPARRVRAVGRIRVARRAAPGPPPDSDVVQALVRHGGASSPARPGRVCHGPGLIA
ncbi:hypothetical protein BFJ72_g14822 [Fusarium proliferatum]|uniref:Uncharacterized protein n=1 Tax=Gibberella intermedia TaxID=948311 RepID=A0A420RY57_GIBIN|nr:hypothetical protein BFJ72_g14822 [Fusarium proliferatum]